MPRKRRSYPVELKAKVALEAAREAEIKELRAKVGELVIERDFLSKAFGR